MIVFVWFWTISGMILSNTDSSSTGALKTLRDAAIALLLVSVAFFGVFGWWIYKYQHEHIKIDTEVEDQFIVAKRKSLSRKLSALSEEQIEEPSQALPEKSRSKSLSMNLSGGTTSNLSEEQIEEKLQDLPEEIKERVLQESEEEAKKEVGMGFVTSKDLGFFETQYKLFCGKHSINNIFAQNVVKTDEDGKNAIQKYCELKAAEINDPIFFNVEETCDQITGFYGIDVLQLYLQEVLRCEVDVMGNVKNLFDRLTKSSDDQGYVVGNGGHWIAIRIQQPYAIWIDSYNSKHPFFDLRNEVARLQLLQQLENYGTVNALAIKKNCILVSAPDALIPGLPTIRKLARKFSRSLSRKQSV